MKIIAGLGNPGPKYETTRHNAGFLALDRLIDRWNAKGPTNKFQSELFQAEFEGDKILIIKPQTYMNLSGKSVGQFLSFFQCKPEDLIVVHDDLDLPALCLRLKKGGGPGGHNGLKSIDESLGKGQNGYYRIRIGIGHPTQIGSRVSPADYVLLPFSNSELKDLDLLLDDAAGAIEMILRGQFQAAMNQYHRESKGAGKSEAKVDSKGSSSGKKDSASE